MGKKNRWPVRDELDTLLLEWVDVNGERQSHCYHRHSNPGILYNGMDWETFSSFMFASLESTGVKASSAKFVPADCKPDG